MSTQQERPPRTEADPESDAITFTRGDVVGSIVSDPNATVRPGADFRANLERMARRAAADPAFYEIAGGTVRYLADQLRADDAA